MSDKQISLGDTVKSKEGKSLGSVEHLVIDARRNTLASFVIDKGLFDRGRVCLMDYVDNVDGSEVVLTLTTAEAENLPGFVEQEFFQFHDTTTAGFGGMGGGGLYDTGGGGNVWYHYGPTGSGQPSTGASSFFQPAVMGNVETKIMSPLDESDVVLSKGTDVITRDGHKIGVIDELTLGEKNKITGFTVKAGHVFHHDIAVPTDWIVAVTHDHVRLNVDRATAEAAKTA